MPTQDVGPTIPLPIDPAAVPALCGVFEPIKDERDAVGLVVEGEVPSEFIGAYIRNGPNPLFPPLGSYTYPIDGDGMVHGLWFDGPRARYRNRIVWTPHLRYEVECQKAVWAGLMTPYLPGTDAAPEELANTYKPLADVNVIAHAGRLLALCEVDPPVELTADLETVGPYTFGGAIGGMCAHPRIDAKTGELVFFRYNLEEPYLMWASVGADGLVAQAPVAIDVDGMYMIHDFVITTTYVVLFVAPAIFDFAKAGILDWQPQRGMRICITRRDGSGLPQWIDTDAFWVWHFANAFERSAANGETEIVVDYTRWSHLPLGGPPATGQIARAVLNLRNGTFRQNCFDDVPAEFSRIDDRLHGQEHRYFNATGKSGETRFGEQNTLIRINTATDGIERWVSGDWVFDEVVFVPRPGGELEDGYYATFRTDRTTLESDFVLLDSCDISAGPVARVKMPFRVPAGLHGNWIPHDSMT